MRFYATGVTVVTAAIVGKFAGADDFDAYPTIEVGLDPATIAVSAVVVLAGLAPWRRNA